MTKFNRNTMSTLNTIAKKIVHATKIAIKCGMIGQRGSDLKLEYRDFFTRKNIADIAQLANIEEAKLLNIVKTKKQKLFLIGRCAYLHTKNAN